MTGLEEIFRDFRRSAWRLETRDSYDVQTEQGELDEWQRTGYIAPHPDWEATIVAARGRGATIGRVRLVGHPITDYTRYEFDAFQRYNLPAGEDIRVVDRAWLDKTWDAAPDFWIFDGTDVWVLDYTTAGAFLGARQLGDITPYQDLRQRITPYAVPLATYQLADIPPLRTVTSKPAPLPQGIAKAG